MKLKRIQLKNIGQFSQLNINFATSQTENLVTVLLGGQNTGKTTILKQIFQGLSWFTNRHKDPRASGITMLDTDIKYETTNASVLIEVSYPNELGHVVSDIQAKPRTEYTCTWKLQKMRQNAGTLNISASELSELEALVSRYQKQLVADPLFSTPCIAYYPVERFVYEVNVQGKNALSTLTPLHNAYDLTAVNFTTFNKFFEWFREIHDVENAQAAKLFKQYLDPQKRFESQDDLNNAFTSIEQAFRLSSQRCISSLKATLKAVIPEVQDIELEYSPKLNLMIKHQERLTPFLQLPQSTRIWIGLIGDLVRRLCLLNPESLYPCLEGEGIVMIDGIDLLLDSENIQNILPRLQRAFPRLQFIASCSSEQIMEHPEIVQCYLLKDGKADHVQPIEHRLQLKNLYDDAISQELPTTPAVENITVKQEIDLNHILSAAKQLNDADLTVLIDELLLRSKEP